MNARRKPDLRNRPRILEARHQASGHKGTRAPYMNLKHFCLSGGILVLKRTLSARYWV